MNAPTSPAIVPDSELLTAVLSSAPADIAMFASEYAEEPHPPIRFDVENRLEGNPAALVAWGSYVEAVDALLDLQGCVDPHRYLPETDAGLPVPDAYARADESWESQRDYALAALLAAVA